MKEALLQFVQDNNLSPFDSSKPSLKQNADSIYKTRDAKAIHTKTINHLCKPFVFGHTSALWNFFSHPKTFDQIKARQSFFSSLNPTSPAFLHELSSPRKSWRPKYDIIAVTEDESTFVSLQKQGITTQLLVSENDVLDLERYDIVQVVGCDDFRLLLERLPQTVFVHDLADVYLERYLEELSSHAENLKLLSKYDLSSELAEVVQQLLPLLSLMQQDVNEILSEEKVERILEDINQSISDKIKELTISGDSLMKMLGEAKMPPQIVSIIQDAVGQSGVSEHVFNLQIPVTIDYKELEDQIKRQSAQEFTNLAEEIKRHAADLKQVPVLIKRLESLLVFEDFCIGVASQLQDKTYPSNSTNIHITGAKNVFLDNPQAISFQLDEFSKCSILTGANSGGKTTLLEHLIQIITLYNLGLPVFGECHLPILSDVYYFAKNKGSASKGAFETLLSQMANISPGPSTLILADEIEAVTEPGIAGKIIAATASFFIQKNCFLVFATHLGHEIRHVLPSKARIDGIEAKGLDDNHELIVDHSPVMGRLAHSTPELIIERMAKSSNDEYFQHLQRAVRKTQQ